MERGLGSPAPAKTLAHESGLRRGLDTGNGPSDSEPRSTNCASCLENAAPTAYQPWLVWQSGSHGAVVFGRYE